MTQQCKYDEQLLDYVYGELSETEARRFADHLQGCGACAAQVASFGRVRQEFKNRPPIEPAGESLQRMTALLMQAATESAAAGSPAATKGDEAPGGSAGVAYQGLPAKFLMPTGTGHSSFSREMLSTRARAVHVVMLSRPVVSATGDVLVALALLLIALQLRLLRRSVSEQWQKVLAARSPAPAAAPST